MKTSEDEQDLIPTSWIEMYNYCPRTIYFLGYLGLRERQTDFMKEGQNEQEVVEQKEKRRQTVLANRKEKVLMKWMDLFLSSEELGLVGSADMILQTEAGLKVVDIKASAGRKLYLGYLYQAAAYGMMAEERLRIPLRSIIIYYTKSDTLFEIRMSDAIRHHIIYVIAKIRRILKSGWMPSATRKNECPTCSYYYICKGVH